MSEKACRILLVEDDERTATIVQRYLTLHGHQVTVANDVHTARDLAESQEFDVLLSDLALPDGDGWRLMQHLKSARHMPGVAMSGFNSAVDVARSLAAGFADHLAKPLAVDALERSLSRAVAD